MCAGKGMRCTRRSPAGSLAPKVDGIIANGLLLGWTTNCQGTLASLHLAPPLTHSAFPIDACKKRIVNTRKHTRLAAPALLRFFKTFSPSFLWSFRWFFFQLIDFEYSFLFCSFLHCLAHRSLCASMPYSQVTCRSDIGLPSLLQKRNSIVRSVCSSNP